MEEREVITLGFGNYATLVAAQWANSTSRYDLHHRTLYRERSRAHIVGGGGGDGEGAGSAFVPRLLLLDSPHASDFRELSDVVNEMEHEEEEEGKKKGQRGGDVAAHNVSSLLWQKDPNASPPTAEEEEVRNAAAFAQRRWWQRRRREDNDDDDEDAEDEGEDGEEDFFYRLPRRHGASGVDSAAAAYPDADNGDTAEVEGKEEGGEEQPQSLSAAQYKKRLFRLRDGTVPWWRYITTGLDVESITTLRPQQRVEGAGDVPTMHNFGHGLATFKSGNSSGSSSAEAENLTDALRRQLEDADGLQGLQCFIDGDTMFGGAAHNVLREFWDDVGPKMPAVLFTLFSPLPPVLLDSDAAKSVPFAERRREETALNRLLATSLLSEPRGAVYLPLEVGNWAEFFSAAAGAEGGGDGCWWASDDTATAQYAAAVADSALYGARDGGEEKGPAFYLSEWARTLRPNPSNRVSALLGSLPLPLPTAAADEPSRDLWRFMSHTPLLPSVAEAGGEDGAGQPRPARRGDFVPLTHAFTRHPASEAGRVVGHAVTLRGAGVLPSAVYPTREALMRYALPLRTATYLPLITRTNLPVSSTFPLELLHESAAAAAAMEAQLRAAGIGDPRAAFAEHGVDVGAHAVTTYQSAPMLQGILGAARAALRYKEHLYSQSYGFEKDDWAERLEDVAELWDDYRHGDNDDDGDGSDDDANDW